MALLKLSFSSKTLERTVDVNVVLPAENLEESKRLNFKTLYLLHGYTGNQDDWLTYTTIRTISEKYNLALVMPSGENSFYTDNEATGCNYGEYIGKELVDFTRKILPLSNKREDTFIGGLSMGGFGALRIGALYGNTFSKIISLSGAFIIKNLQTDKDFYKTSIANKSYFERLFGNIEQLDNSNNNPVFCVKNSDNMPDVFMACGTEDYLINENRDMKNTLENCGVNIKYEESSGIHDWEFWEKNINIAIKWIFES